MYQGGDVPWAVKNPENDDKGSAVGAGKSGDSHLCDPLGGGRCSRLDPLSLLFSFSDSPVV